MIITTGMAIIGALAVAQNKALFANTVWSISNPLLMGYNFINGEYEQIIMFAIFAIVAWYGVYNLKRGESIEHFRNGRYIRNH